MKWIDVPVLIYERIFDSRRYHWYSCYDDIYWQWLRHTLAVHAG